MKRFKLIFILAVYLLLFIFILFGKFYIQCLSVLTVAFFSYALLSNENKERLVKFSTFGTLISILVALIIYQDQRRRDDIKINFNLQFENKNNGDLNSSLKENEAARDYRRVYLMKFKYPYSEQYPYYNLRNTSSDCLSSYSQYINNMEAANGLIETIFFLKQQDYLKETDAGVVETVTGQLFRINRWIDLNITALKKDKCWL